MRVERRTFLAALLAPLLAAAVPWRVLGRPKRAPWPDCVHPRASDCLELAGIETWPVWISESNGVTTRMYDWSRQEWREVSPTGPIPEWAMNHNA